MAWITVCSLDQPCSIVRVYNLLIWSWSLLLEFCRDIGTIYADGRFKIKGRESAEFCLTVRRCKFWPSEIEEIVSSHPSIAAMKVSALSILCHLIVLISNWQGCNDLQFRARDENIHPIQKAPTGSVYNSWLLHWTQSTNYGLRI